ncbi:hypothetical protein D3C77_416210 [compost metagenome]
MAEGRQVFAHGYGEGVGLAGLDQADGLLDHVGGKQVGGADFVVFAVRRVLPVGGQGGVGGAGQGAGEQQGFEGFHAGFPEREVVSGVDSGWRREAEKAVWGTMTFAFRSKARGVAVRASPRRSDCSTLRRIVEKVVLVALCLYSRCAIARRHGSIRASR